MEKKEFLRRIKLLGLENETVFDIGETGNFIPVDPGAEPLHPDWVATSDYGGGAYDSNSVFHSDCRNQYCGAHCEVCERNIAVLINGARFKRFDPKTCTFSLHVPAGKELWGISSEILKNVKVSDEISAASKEEWVKTIFVVRSCDNKCVSGFFKTVSTRPEDSGIIYRDEWACFYLMGE